MKENRTRIIRFAGLSVAIIFIAWSFFTAIEAIRKKRLIEKAKAHILIEKDVDFSKLGICRFEFLNTNSNQGIDVFIKGERADGRPILAESVADDLLVSVFISDIKKKGYRKIGIDHSCIIGRENEGAIHIISLPPLPEGRYSAKIVVDKPAKALSLSKKQKLYAKYTFCSCEEIGIWVAYIFAIAQLGIGMSLVIFFMRGILRNLLGTNVFMLRKS